jgi:hypothetical protein
MAKRKQLVKNVPALVAPPMIVEAEEEKQAIIRGRPLPKGKKLGGRKKGTPNAATQHMRDMMEMAAHAVGFDGKGQGGALGYLARYAMEHMKEFNETWAKIEPRKVAVQHDQTFTANVRYETVEEARKALEDHGIVIDAVLSD